MTEQDFFQALAARGLTVTPEAQARLRAYHALLTEWNSRINLVSRQAQGAVYEELYYDSLEPVLAGLMSGTARGADVGSGAGIPGLLLAIFVPGLVMTLVESRRNRALFLRQARETLRLDAVTVAHQPVAAFGAVPGVAGTFDYVFFKAFADTVTCLKAGQGLVKATGAMILYKGADTAGELEQAQKAFPGYRFAQTAYQLPRSKKKRNLIVVSRARVD
jgi:16S rRNA (guanine527-N7)-methyltransferase